MLLAVNPGPGPRDSELVFSPSSSPDTVAYRILRDGVAIATLTATACADATCTFVDTSLASDGTVAERGASYAFLDVVAQAIKFSAKHGNWDAHFERKAKEDAQWVAMEREREAQRIARSIATRKARQAAKQGGAA